MAKIKIVRGNTLTLSIPLTKRVLVLTDGGKVGHSEDFSPTNPVIIWLTDDARRYRFEAQVSGNVATIESAGNLPIGTYDIEVTSADDNGKPLRYKSRSAVDVVDATCEAGIEAGIEFDGTAYYLDGAVFLSIKGDPGKDGLTPHIGENGNWWIGDHDTGINPSTGIEQCYTKGQVDELVRGVTHAVNYIREDILNVKPLVVPVTMNGATPTSRIDFGVIQNAILEDRRDVIVLLDGRVFLTLHSCNDESITFSYVDFEEHFQSLLSVNDQNEWSIYDFVIEGGGESGGYNVAYDNGNIIFTGSNQPTFNNGNIIF